MLRVIAAAFIVVLTCGLTARATLLAYDGFDYPAGEDLSGQNGGVGWNGPWANQGGATTSVASSGLSYPGLSVIGNAATTGPQPAGLPSSITTYPRVADTTIFGGPGTTLYYSFLLQPNAGAGFYGGLNIGDLFIGVSGNQTTYGLESSTIALSSTPVVQGVTALLVVQAVFGAADDTFNLYVDPALPGVQPATPDATLTQADSTVSSTLYINNAGGYTLDELNIGTTYADVVPVPEPSAALPVAAGALLLMRRASGGQAAVYAAQINAVMVK